MKKRFLALILAAAMAVSMNAGLYCDTAFASEINSEMQDAEYTQTENTDSETDAAETESCESETETEAETEAEIKVSGEESSAEEAADPETAAESSAADSAPEAGNTENDTLECEEEEWPYDEVEDGIPTEITAEMKASFAAVSDSNPNTWTNTGNQAADIVAVARTQVGYAETSSGYTKYGAWYASGYSTSAWCAMFISWCADQAGIPTTTIKKNARASGYSVKTMASNPFGTATAFALGTKTPQPGDIIFVDNNNDEISNHVGLVVSVDSNYIYTIEGNYLDQVYNVKYSRTTGARALGSGFSTKAFILFFARPAYTGSGTVVDDSTGNTTDSEDDASEDSYDYSIYQTANSSSNLNVRSGPGTNYTKLGYFTPGSQARIRISEIKDNWGYTETKNSVNSSAGWVCLDYCALISIGIDTVMTNYNGLCQNVDGEWYYFTNGLVDASYNGMAECSSGWWLVTDGRRDTSYTGIYEYSDKESWYLVDGKWASSYDGLVEGETGWYYISDGKVDTDYTGLAQKNGELIYLTDGVEDTSFTGLAQYDCDWWLVTNGKKDTSYTGLYKYNDEWWYLVNGKFQASYTGMAEGKYGWWYVVNGKIDMTYTGMVKNDSQWIYVTNGKQDTTYTGMAKNAYGWWYMVDGLIDFTYTGMAKNSYGWWYMANGKLDLTYTGMAKNSYGWWYIIKGQMSTTFTGIAHNAYGYWYFKNGKIATTYTGTVKYGGYTWKVTKGKAVKK